MRRLSLLILLFACLGCPRSEPKGDDKKDAETPVVPAPPAKVMPPSQPVDPDKNTPDEKPKF